MQQSTECKMISLVHCSWFYEHHEQDNVLATVQYACPILNEGNNFLLFLFLFEIGWLLFSMSIGLIKTWMVALLYFEVKPRFNICTCLWRPCHIKQFLNRLIGVLWNNIEPNRHYGHLNHKSQCQILNHCWFWKVACV